MKRKPENEIKTSVNIIDELNAILNLNKKRKSAFDKISKINIEKSTGQKNKITYK